MDTEASNMPHKRIQKALKMPVSCSEKGRLALSPTTKMDMICSASTASLVNEKEIIGLGVVAHQCRLRLTVHQNEGNFNPL